MDLLTHVLTAYLLTYGITGFRPSYLAAGALAGGLPDADILFLPLWRRFPILRHHGITHSFFGVTVVAVVGAVVAPSIAPGSPVVYFLVLLAGGVSHVLEDAFTNFSVPPLLPFRADRLELDADRAINLVTLVVSVVAFWLLGGVERGHVPFSIFVATIYLLTAFFVAYFALRLGLRLYLGRIRRRLGPYETVLPTGSPLSWILLTESKAGGRFRTAYGRFRFLPRRVEGPFVVEAPMEAEGERLGPIVDRADALARSYPLARRTSRFLDDTYHFADVDRAPEGWSVTWYSLEYSMLGRSAAVTVRFDADGRATARRAWYAPHAPGGA